VEVCRRIARRRCLDRANGGPWYAQLSRDRNSTRSGSDHHHGDRIVCDHRAAAHDGLLSSQPGRGPQGVDIVRTKRRVRLPDVASTERRFRSMHCASAPAGQASTPHANDELARTAVCRGAKPASIGRAFPWKCRGAESDLARPRRSGQQSRSCAAMARRWLSSASSSCSRRLTFQVLAMSSGCSPMLRLAGERRHNLLLRRQLVYDLQSRPRDFRDPYNRLSDV
jgi:hypothetical protein